MVVAAAAAAVAAAVAVHGAATPNDLAQLSSVGKQKQRQQHHHHLLPQRLTTPTHPGGVGVGVVEMETAEDFQTSEDIVATTGEEDLHLTQMDTTDLQNTASTTGLRPITRMNAGGQDPHTTTNSSIGKGLLTSITNLEKSYVRLVLQICHNRIM